ncbi:hydroxyacid dehydrogenase [Minwuia thermotolerans]|uniref:3-phosphoglycerate dehydrogenase n=1 Tax=Minwuia thermotolerans TaxID=2056226 RepID=A0A2M9G1V1_9PROT|nr:hydroxyacid dehydrogenase [Minwuia thermotolerans]PJK29685.1 3-phosphoglycerate dehydrogenase [Minwuia thermotolerans]
MPKIVYLDAFPADNALDILKPHAPGLEVVRIGRDQPLEDSFAALADAHAYQCVPARDEVPEPLRIHREFLARAPELLVVSSGGSGVDTFDIDACTEAGVLVVNQAGGNAEAVAEHALGMMLMLLKKAPQSDRALRRGWNGARVEFRGADLLGKTVGIIGLGHVGARMAEICRSAFRCEVLACDPYIARADFAERNAVQADFEEVLTRADIVTVHTPLTPETRGMLNAEAFARMKPGALFVTTARGSIHDEAALAEALESGRLGGAGLDVWDTEPPAADHPLLGFDNVIATPHTAGVTRDSRERMAEYAATQLIGLMAGGDPARPVNPEVLPRYRARFREILGG